MAAKAENHIPIPIDPATLLPPPDQRRLRRIRSSRTTRIDLVKQHGMGG